MSKLVKASVIFACALFICGNAWSIPTLGMTETTFEHQWHGGQQWTWLSAINFFEDDVSGDPLGYSLSHYGDYATSMSWTHTLPDNLGLPADEILDAKLWINATMLYSDGNSVEIEGAWEWDSLNRGWFFGMGNSNTLYDLTGLSDDAWNSGGIDVSVFAGNYNAFRINFAVMGVTYIDNDGTTQAAIPEPLTLGLFGLGLLGVGISARRKRT